MKKLWAFLLAFAMVAAMGAPALAEDTTTDTNKTTNTGTTTDIAVNGLHTPTTTPTVISADIAWDPMDFTYNKQGQMWNPEKHQFINNTESGWVWDHKTDKQNWPYIRLTNHSNINITAKPEFNGADGFSIYQPFSSYDLTLYLRSAEDTLIDNPPYTETYFEVETEDGITESKDIGTITVTIKKGETTQVANEVDLNNMYLTTPSVVLTKDIELKARLYRDNFSGILDLAGHTLTSDVNNEKGSIVFEGDNLITIKNGTITGSGTRLLHFGQDRNGAVDVTMKNCTINTEATVSGTDYAIWVDGATLRLQDCTINSDGAVGVNVTKNSYGRDGKVILSGDIKINTGEGDLKGSLFTRVGDCSVTCLAGIYNFDPTEFVNNTYTVTHEENTTIWTVTAK